MYRVAVCEDEPNLREALCAQCRGILGRLEVFHEVIPFATAEGLEEALSKGAQFDLLCLDILLTGKSGMELALDVRKRDDRVSILFITVSTDFLLEGYGARPIQYLLKPVQEKDLEKALRTDLRLPPPALPGHPEIRQQDHSAALGRRSGMWRAGTTAVSFTWCAMNPFLP